MLIFETLLILTMMSAMTDAHNVIEAGCNSTCSCKLISGDYDKEFRVVCKGNGTQELSLGISIFKDEPLIEEYDLRKVHVKIEKFAVANIRESFVSRWLSYDSCSFDIMNIDRVVFPQEIHSKHSEDLGTFAGIGILSSKLDNFPMGLMAGKASAGLKILRSKMPHIDIGSLLGTSSLNYLKLLNSSIGILSNSLTDKIPLSYLSGPGDPVIQISDSNIGMVDRGGLAFQNYNYEEERAKVDIANSILGVVMKDSMHFGDGIAFKMAKSNIGVLLPSALWVGKGSDFNIINSTIGVMDNALTKFECDQNFAVFNNSFLPLDWMQTVQKCDNCTKNLFNFVHESCGVNALLTLDRANVIDTKESTKNAPKNDSFNESCTNCTNKLQNCTNKTTFAMLFTNGTNKSTMNEFVPLGFWYGTNGMEFVPIVHFYFVSSVALLLFIVVLGLVAILVFGNCCNSRKQKKNEFVRSDALQKECEILMGF